ncbi:MAG: UDP-2,4-diacetamido-2,4,6-trideoxy-beta-L-altropyranose hydrolase [Rhodospirillaceae bacterium]|nr:UDP-2,4-diacetamido-2,4,6-trideoxy-beta-L-altropyranose hydrolase [Rhodospirillales bacterium]
MSPLPLPGGWAMMAGMCDAFSPYVVFHCNASVPLGVGHAMRCLTLADALAARGWRTAFAVNAEALTLVADLTRHDQVQVPPPEPADFLVVDNYSLDAAFEAPAREWARHILVIDDLADRPHDCDLLLDQTLGRQAADYGALVPQSCTLLTGTGYALLRPRFAQLRDTALARRRDACRKVMISLGGTDPGGAGRMVLDGVAQSGLALQVIMVVGRGTPGIDGLRAAMGALGIDGEVREGVGDMAAVMAECDLAIGTGGTTSWERCCLGLPSLVLVTADNQTYVARMLEQWGAARVLANVGHVAQALRDLVGDHAARQRMAQSAAVACDGLGAQRVAEAMEARLLRLRRAGWDDSDDLLAWRNDPQTRATARNTGLVPVENHLAWLTAVLADPNRLLLVGEQAGEKVGTIRFDRQDEDSWEVSITVAPSARGRGMGNRLLAAGIAIQPKLLDGGVLLATVGTGNMPSRRIFETNGFTLVDEAEGWRHYIRR